MRKNKQFRSLAFVVLLLFAVLLPYAGVVAEVDLTPPSVVSSTPEANAESVSPAAVISVVFDENIQQGDQWSTITVMQNGSTSIPVTTSIEANTLTIEPPAEGWDDSRGYLYTLTVPTAAIKDLAGNCPAADFQISFRTADSQAPAVLSVDPPNGTTGVATDKPWVMTFDENITVNPVLAGNISCVITPAQTYSLSLRYIVSGKTLTLLPSYSTIWDSGFGLKYTITIPAGTICDSKDTSRTITAPMTYSFTTKDLQAPKVSSVTPANNSTGIAQSAVISIKFNKAVVAGYGFNSISVKNPSGTALAITKSWTSSTTLQIKPANGGVWPHTTQLRIGLPAGAVKSACSSINNAAWSSVFTTIDKTAPTRVASYPAWAATNVDPLKKAYLTFSENIYVGPNYSQIKATCNGSAVTLTKNLAGRSVSFMYGTRWTYGKTYIISVPAGAIKDAAGNPNPSAISLKFTIKQKPVALSFTSISPLSTRIKGSTANFNYTIDKTCNIKVEIINGSGTVKRVITKSGVTAGSRTIYWDGNQTGGSDLPYGSYTVKITATPTDLRYASTSVTSRTLKIVAKAALSVSRITTSWDIEYDDFYVYFLYNITGKLSISFYDASSKLILSESFSTIPMTEGISTNGWLGWDGYLESGKLLPHGTYKVVLKLSNAASSASVTKYVKVY